MVTQKVPSLFGLTLGVGAGNAIAGWDNQLRKAFGVSTFVAPIFAPVVLSLSVTTGPTSGGTITTITGQFFTGATSVTLSGVAATINLVNDSTINVTSWSGPVGLGDVVVTTPVGSGTLRNGWTYTSTAPFALMMALANGQSLSVGQNGHVSPDTSQPYANKMLHDSSGTYDITQPTAATLSLTSLVFPMRPGGTAGNQYPTNLTGEDPTTAYCNTLTQLMLADGYGAWNMSGSSTGQGGAAMSVIQKSGTGDAYAAGTYECTAIHHLAPGTFGVDSIIFTHGETDSLNNNASYGTQLVTLQANYESDLKAITGQSGSIPMIVSLQASSPTSMTYPDVVNAQVVAAAQANPTKIYVAGPRYQFQYNANDVHLNDYRPVGELYAKVRHAILKNGTWSPLWLTNASRVGTTVTCTFNVPVAPLVFDTRQGPHGTGTRWSMWGTTGFEAWDRALTITSLDNNTPRKMGFSTAHNLSTGDTLACFNVGGVTALDDVFTVTVVDSTHVTINGSVTGSAYTAGGTAFSPIGITNAVIAGSTVQLTLSRSPIGAAFVGYANQCDVAAQTGGGGFTQYRCGLLRDSDPFTGPSGFANPNWAIHFTASI